MHRETSFWLLIGAIAITGVMIRPELVFVGALAFMAATGFAWRWLLQNNDRTKKWLSNVETGALVVTALTSAIIIRPSFGALIAFGIIAALLYGVRYTAIHESRADSLPD